MHRVYDSSSAAVAVLFFGHRDVDNSLLGLNLDQRRREHAAVASGSSS
jgi:hypothetical protein